MLLRVLKIVILFLPYLAMVGGRASLLSGCTSFAHTPHTHAHTATSWIVMSPSRCHLTAARQLLVVLHPAEAMLFKDDKPHCRVALMESDWDHPSRMPIISCSTPGKFRGNAAIRFGHANSDIQPDVCGIGFRDVNISCVDSTCFTCCRLTVTR